MDSLFYYNIKSFFNQMWLLLSNDLNSIIINFNEHYFISFISSLFQVHYKDGCHYKGTEKVDDNNWSAHFPFFRSVPVPNPNATTPQR